MVLTLIAAWVSSPRSASVLILKPTLTLPSSSSMELDLADADAGEPDLVVDLEAAGLVELRVVGLAATDQRQVLGAERGDEAEDEHGEAHEADDDGIALPERLCSWQRAPRRADGVERLERARRRRS